MPAPQTGNDATGIPVPKTDIEPVQFSNSCSTATDVPLLQDVITPLAASPDLAAARSSDTSAIASAQGESLDVVCRVLTWSYWPLLVLAGLTGAHCEAVKDGGPNQFRGAGSC